MNEEQNPHVDSDPIEFTVFDAYEQRRSPDPELAAMATIIEALMSLDVYARSRVMNWIERRLRDIP